LIRSYNQVAGRSLERIAALSDGVFAIAMTLIVLEIRVPDPGPIHSEQELWNALLTLSPRLITYLMSFLTLGIFWNAQQTGLSHFARADRDLTWLELGFLAAVALMPFSTSLLAEFISFRIALLAYWANVALLGIVLYAAWSYALRATLLRDDTPANASRLIKRRIIGAQALYLFGALLCIVSTYVSIAFIVLVQLNFAIAPRVRWLSRI
jgi:uncharacterized membrane protein